MFVGWRQLLHYYLDHTLLEYLGGEGREEREEGRRREGGGRREEGGGREEGGEGREVGRKERVDDRMKCVCGCGCMIT